MLTQGKQRKLVFSAAVLAFGLCQSAVAQDYVEVTPPASAVTASTHDGNLPGNTVDGSLATRWSANGDGQWITYDLGSVRTVGYLRIAWYNGNLRQGRFDLQVSADNAAWTSALTGGVGSGTTTALETFDFPDVDARWVRYLGHGNSVNGWNSLSEVELFAAGAATPTATPTPTPTPAPTATPTPTPAPAYEEVTPGAGAVTASTHDGNLPANTVDNSLETRWSANGDGQWIRWDLGTSRTVAHVALSIYSGNTRQSRFDLQVSGDGTTWSNVLTAALSNGTTTQQQTFDFPDTAARYVRYLGHGNTANAWNSLQEVDLYAVSCSSCPTPTPGPTATPTPTPTPSTSTCASRLNNGGPPSTWVYYDAGGRLQYKTITTLYDYNGASYSVGGGRIMDFSHAGYKGGGVALPSAPVKVNLTPAASGDDTARLQAAINQVAALPLDANGIRGAVMLAAGTYRVYGTLNISASGVVLRGAGSTTAGTVFDLGGTSHEAINVDGTGTRTLGTSVAITGSYVPVGTRTITVSDASSFAVGDAVVVLRPVTSTWVQFMSMHDLMRNGAPQTWLSPGSTIQTDRTIAAISGNQITLDVPLSDSMDARHLNPPFGSIAKSSFPTRISQVGIEGLRIQGRSNPIGYKMFSMDAVTDAWAKNLYGVDLRSGLSVGDTAKRVTIDNVTLDHTYPDLDAAAPSDFNVSGTQTLVMRSKSLNASGWFNALTQSTDTGPIVLLDFQATQGTGIQPHQRWATGMLTDRANITGGVQYLNRGHMGSGHGWTMGWGVAWNSNAGNFILQRPPGTLNWGIGNIGTIRDDDEPGNTGEGNMARGVFESHGTKVNPSSLYLAQLCDRLGPAALTNIGY